MIKKIFIKSISFVVGCISIAGRVIRAGTSTLYGNISSDNELKTRVYSGIIFGAIFIAAIISGGMFFNVIMLIILIVMFEEWNNIISPLKVKSFTLYQIWLLGGVAYTVIPIAAIVSLRSLEQGMSIVLWYFMIIWVTDCAAYFGGKKLQGPKLAPTISPGKTLSGFIVGISLAGVIGGVSYSCLTFSPLGEVGIIGCTTLSVIISFAAQLSDLIESMIKRRFGVKDSGNFIPGHGGLLDRMDSTTLSAPLLLIIFNNIISKGII